MADRWAFGVRHIRIWTLMLPLPLYPGSGHLMFCLLSHYLLSIGFELAEVVVSKTDDN